MLQSGEENQSPTSGWIGDITLAIWVPTASVRGTGVLNPNLFYQVFYRVGQKFLLVFYSVEKKMCFET